MNLLYLGGVVLTYALGVGSVTDSVSRMPLVRVGANTSTLESTNVPTAVAAKDHSAAVDISSAVVQNHKRNGEVLQAPPPPKASTTELDCPLQGNALLEARSLTELKKKARIVKHCAVYISPHGLTNGIANWALDRIIEMEQEKKVCKTIDKIEIKALFGPINVTLRVLPVTVPTLPGYTARIAPTVCISGKCQCMRE